MTKLYSVTELAQELDVTPRALRFYEDKGLIAPQRAGKTRVYTHRDRGRMILILRGKRLGFSLKEIAEWLDLYDSDPGQVEQMRLTLNKARDRIETLEAQHRDLQQTLDELRSIASDVEDFLKSKGASIEAAE
ncbi:MerR family transcriptional regulator [Pelagibius sp.]|uniref:MerR family transcriptional regulator n=1 Tax=Pelagibius sp. TaxID=1931238 RepID=UPI003B51029D